MHLKSVKILLFVLLSLTVACLLIGGGLSKPVYFLLAAAFAAGYAIAYAALWRCPYCGKHIMLGVLAVKDCPRCRRNLATGKKIKKRR